MLTINKETNWNERARQHAGDEMVLNLTEGSIHHAWEDAVFEEQDVDGEGEKACWSDTEEDEASALGIEPIHDRIDKRQRLEKAVVGSVENSGSECQLLT